MKKFRIAALVFFVLLLLSALAVGANAKWWDENPYSDVRSDAWYYDAVRICKEQGVFSGTSDTAFGIKKTMTRAMFVTALAGAADYDKEAYADAAPFDDVPAGKWYSAPVAWASEKGITGGTGDGVFSPNRAITRQEFVTMLRKFAEAAGYDASAGETALDSFADADRVAAWARESMIWAYEKGIVSGVKKTDGTYLQPKATATREQAAQMVVRLLYTKPIREINGNDLSLYRIVYNKDTEGDEDTSEESAEKLCRYIKDSLGYDLPVVTDETEPYEYEILVGWTNREDMGLVTVDRDSFESDQIFLCQVQGNRLVICGIDSDTHEGDHDHKTYNVSGTRNAVFYFGEYCLGVETYSQSNGGIYKYSPDPIISFPDGWTYSDRPFFRSRVFYMSGGILGTGRYNSEVSETMYDWMGITNSGDELHADTPCMSDEEHIEAVIRNVKKALDNKPYASVVGIGIMDSNGYCNCENCKTLYRQYGSLSATLCLLVNRVCEAIEDDYPGVKVCFGAYTYVAKPPKDLVMHKNAIVEFFSIDCCYGHEYTDKTCPLNKVVEEYVDGWNAITQEMWFWDHCGNFELMMTPVPDWDSMRQNIRYFAEKGSVQVLMNSVLDSGYRYSDFGYLRGYMYSALYRNPFMSEAEFNFRLNKGLEAYYGEGWRGIREYLDTIAELGNSRHHRHHAGPVSYYDYDEVCAVADHLDELWAEAFAKAEGNEKMTERLTLANHSWIFLRQCATWESRYKNGTEEQREAYMEANAELCRYIFDHDISWTEGTLDTLDKYDPTLSPEHW